MQIEPGSQARAQRTVRESDTAQAVGTGRVAVLATSQVVAFCEAATFDVLAPHTPQGSTSVAMRVHVDHLRAVTVGTALTVIATLERVEGRRFVFVVSVIDAHNDEVAHGRITRVVVAIEPFLAKASGASR